MGHSTQNTEAFGEQSRRQRLVLEIIWGFVRFICIIVIIYLVFSWVVSRFEMKSTKQRRERRNRERSMTNTDRSIEMHDSRMSQDSRRSSDSKENRLI